MEKFSDLYGTIAFQGTPPEKIFVELLGLKSLSEKGLKRNSKRITVKKHPYTHLSKYAVLLCRLSDTSRKFQ